jgi:hypothetical protein
MTTVTTGKPPKSPATRRALMDLAQSLTKEKHIQETVVEFLKLDGWRAFRTELTVQRERGRVVGERGQPDYLFLRYSYVPGNQPVFLRSGCQHLWIEFKRPGEKPRQDQNVWHAGEVARGALVMVVDDIDNFISWYRHSSGLMRRKI